MTSDQAVKALYAISASIDLLAALYAQNTGHSFLYGFLITNFWIWFVTSLVLVLKRNNEF